jgi:hypothetical protein
MKPPIGLRLRLLERVAASDLRERQFLTMRRDDGPWQPIAAGARQRPLATTLVASSWVVELAPAASLPPGLSQRRELVVLSGSATLGEAALRFGDAAVDDLARPLQAGPQGARLYLRCSVLAAAGQQVTLVGTLDDIGWDDFCPGVRIRELSNAGERRSVLVRMQPGALVNSHAHALEEECMMLAGEAFIGDTLLRHGEYQLAPAGSRHGAITTDVGAVFFVNGSLDPAAYA